MFPAFLKRAGQSGRRHYFVDWKIVEMIAGRVNNRREAAPQLRLDYERVRQVS